MAAAIVYSSLVLKRASASRPFGEWNDDDYDVLARWRRRPHLPRRGVARGLAVDVNAGLWVSRGPHADARL
jgi:hypothetical protein